MDPILLEYLEGPVILMTLVGLTYAVKVMFWGKGPIRRIKGSAQQQALEERLADLEDRWEQLEVHHEGQVADLEERLEFAERLLSQQQSHKLYAPEEPEISTPV
jgi:hypothetical protein